MKVAPVTAEMVSEARLPETRGDVARTQLPFQNIRGGE